MESRLSINQTGTPLERHTPDLTITPVDVLSLTDNIRFVYLPSIKGVLCQRWV